MKFLFSSAYCCSTLPSSSCFLLLLLSVLIIAATTLTKAVDVNIVSNGNTLIPCLSPTLEYNILGEGTNTVIKCNPLVSTPYAKKITFLSNNLTDSRIELTKVQTVDGVFMYGDNVTGPNSIKNSTLLIRNTKHGNETFIKWTYAEDLEIIVDGNTIGASRGAVHQTGSRPALGIKVEHARNVSFLAQYNNVSCKYLRGIQFRMDKNVTDPGPIRFVHNTVTAETNFGLGVAGDNVSSSWNNTIQIFNNTITQKGYDVFAQAIYIAFAFAAMTRGTVNISSNRVTGGNPSGYLMGVMVASASRLEFTNTYQTCVRGPDYLTIERNVINITSASSIGILCSFADYKDLLMENNTVIISAAGGSSGINVTACSEVARNDGYDDGISGSSSSPALSQKGAEYYMNSSRSRILLLGNAVNVTMRHALSWIGQAIALWVEKGHVQKFTVRSTRVYVSENGYGGVGYGGLVVSMRWNASVGAIILDNCSFEVVTTGTTGVANGVSIFDHTTYSYLYPDMVNGSAPSGGQQKDFVPSLYSPLLLSLVVTNTNITINQPSVASCSAVGILTNLTIARNISISDSIVKVNSIGEADSSSWPQVCTASPTAFTMQRARTVNLTKEIVRTIALADGSNASRSSLHDFITFDAAFTDVEFVVENCRKTRDRGFVPCTGIRIDTNFTNGNSFYEPDDETSRAIWNDGNILSYSADLVSPVLLDGFKLLRANIVVKQTSLRDAPTHENSTYTSTTSSVASDLVGVFLSSLIMPSKCERELIVQASSIYVQMQEHLLLLSKGNTNRELTAVQSAIGFQVADSLARDDHGFGSVFRPSSSNSSNNNNTNNNSTARLPYGVNSLTHNDSLFCPPVIQDIIFRASSINVSISDPSSPASSSPHHVASGMCASSSPLSQGSDISLLARGISLSNISFPSTKFLMEAYTEVAATISNISCFNQGQLLVSEPIFAEFDVQTVLTSPTIQTSVAPTFKITRAAVRGGIFFLENNNNNNNNYNETTAMTHTVRILYTVHNTTNISAYIAQQQETNGLLPTPGASGGSIFNDFSPLFESNRANIDALSSDFTPNATGSSLPENAATFYDAMTNSSSAVSVMCSSVLRYFDKRHGRVLSGVEARVDLSTGLFIESAGQRSIAVQVAGACNYTRPQFDQNLKSLQLTNMEHVNSTGMVAGAVAVLFGGRVGDVTLAKSYFDADATRGGGCSIWKLRIDVTANAWSKLQKMNNNNNNNGEETGSVLALAAPAAAFLAIEGDFNLTHMTTNMDDTIYDLSFIKVYQSTITVSGMTNLSCFAWTWADSFNNDGTLDVDHILPSEDVLLNWTWKQARVKFMTEDTVCKITSRVSSVFLSPSSSSSSSSSVLLGSLLRTPLVSFRSYIVGFWFATPRMSSAHAAISEIKTSTVEIVQEKLFSQQQEDETNEEEAYSSGDVSCVTLQLAELVTPVSGNSAISPITILPQSKYILTNNRVHAYYVNNSCNINVVSDSNAHVRGLDYRGLTGSVPNGTKGQYHFENVNITVKARFAKAANNSLASSSTSSSSVLLAPGETTGMFLSGSSDRGSRSNVIAISSTFVSSLEYGTVHVNSSATWNVRSIVLQQTDNEHSNNSVTWNQIHYIKSLVAFRCCNDTSYSSSSSSITRNSFFDLSALTGNGKHLYSVDSSINVSVFSPPSFSSSSSSSSWIASRPPHSLVYFAMPQQALRTSKTNITRFHGKLDASESASTTQSLISSLSSPEFYSSSSGGGGGNGISIFGNTTIYVPWNGSVVTTRYHLVDARFDAYAHPEGWNKTSNNGEKFLSNVTSLFPPNSPNKMINVVTEKYLVEVTCVRLSNEIVLKEKVEQTGFLNAQNLTAGLPFETRTLFDIESCSATPSLTPTRRTLSLSDSESPSPSRSDSSSFTRSNSSTPYSRSKTRTKTSSANESASTSSSVSLSNSPSDSKSNSASTSKSVTLSASLTDSHNLTVSRSESGGTNSASQERTNFTLSAQTDTQTHSESVSTTVSTSETVPANSSSTTATSSATKSRGTPSKTRTLTLFSASDNATLSLSRRTQSELTETGSVTEHLVPEIAKSLAAEDESVPAIAGTLSALASPTASMEASRQINILMILDCGGATGDAVFDTRKIVPFPLSLLPEHGMGNVNGYYLRGAIASYAYFCGVILCLLLLAGVTRATLFRKSNANFDRYMQVSASFGEQVKTVFFFAKFPCSFTMLVTVPIGQWFLAIGTLIFAQTISSGESFVWVVVTCFFIFLYVYTYRQVSGWVNAEQVRGAPVGAGSIFTMNVVLHQPFDTSEQLKKLARWVQGEFGRWLFLGEVSWHDETAQAQSFPGKLAATLDPMIQSNPRLLAAAAQSSKRTPQSDFIFRWFPRPFAERYEFLFARFLGPLIDEDLHTVDNMHEGKKDTSIARYVTEQNLGTKHGWRCFYFMAFTSITASIIVGAARVRPQFCTAAAAICVFLNALQFLFTIIIQPYLVPFRNLASVLIEGAVLTGSIIAAAYLNTSDPDMRLTLLNTAKTCTFIASAGTVVTLGHFFLRRILINLVLKATPKSRLELWAILSKHLDEHFKLLKQDQKNNEKNKKKKKKQNEDGEYYDDDDNDYDDDNENDATALLASPLLLNKHEQEEGYVSAASSGGGGVSVPVSGGGNAEGEGRKNTSLSKKNSNNSNNNHRSRFDDPEYSLAEDYENEMTTFNSSSSNNNNNSNNRNNKVGSVALPTEIRSLPEHLARLHKMTSSLPPRTSAAADQQNNKNSPGFFGNLAKLFVGEEMDLQRVQEEEEGEDPLSYYRRQQPSNNNKNAASRDPKKMAFPSASSPSAKYEISHHHILAATEREEAEREKAKKLQQQQQQQNKKPSLSSLAKPPLDPRPLPEHLARLRDLNLGVSAAPSSSSSSSQVVHQSPSISDYHYHQPKHHQHQQQQHHQQLHDSDLDDYFEDEGFDGADLFEDDVRKAEFDYSDL